ncbi:MAG TPA: anti-sigma factor [Candidatus Polarisedimenticolia bacterium]|nr:anti-sigma factor [Candidatus Polarisedimenticolia bacterium]
MTNDRCRQARERLAAFLAGELERKASRAIQEHLDACEACRGFVRLETGFSAALRARLRRLDPPDSMRDRVRRRLAAEMLSGSAPQGAADGASRATGGRMKLALATAAAAALLMIPALLLWSPRPSAGGPDGAQAEVRIVGLLVCAECEAKGVPIDVQRRCRCHGHQSGIRCPESGLWHLVVNEASQPILADPDQRGRSVVLHGRAFGDIRYVEARSIAFGSGA